MDLVVSHLQEIKKAHADIQGEGVSGTADFTEYQHDGGSHIALVKVVVSIKAEPGILTPGAHGCHIHEKGVCEPPFQTAGGHFDPGPAGNVDPDVNHPYHMGDLPNIMIDENGEGHLETVTSRITLSEGPLSVLTGEGTCLMIHGNHDQGCSGPSKSGVSGGPRAACGVIKTVN